MSNATLSRIINSNEEDANKAAANVMLITFAIFTAVYILNLVGVFVIDEPDMTIAYCVSSVFLILPTILNKYVPLSAKWLKYLYIIFSELFLLMVTTVLSYHVVVIYAYPIALAGLYFSKKLTNISTLCTLAVTVAGQLLGFFLDLRFDHNFYTLQRLVVYGIIPRILTLLSLAALLRLLTVRTSKLLSEDADNYESLIMYNQDMIYGFATLVESRDESTGGHIKRTSIYAEMLAEELGKTERYKNIIDDEFIGCIAMVAPLHDIGKISIPDNILCKPGRLTPSEFAIMKTHAEKGGQMVRDTFSHIADERYKTMAYEVARYHHEKWNGKGYPEGLSGEKIPLPARIMAVADVFDAVSEKRCYRDAMPIEECFRIIENGMGTDFDPDAAAAFLRIRDKITEERNKNLAAQEAPKPKLEVEDVPDLISFASVRLRH